MAQKTDEEVVQDLNINLDPARTPVLYVDSVYMKVNKNGVVLDFAQQVGPSNQYNIIARVGMSKEHAKDVVENLEALLRVEGTGSTQKKIN